MMAEHAESNLDQGITLAARGCIGLVRIYQATLSPIIGGHCRFQPTCSHYAVDALKTHGAIKGCWLALRRLSRCHPLGGAGHDPVPMQDQQPVESGPEEIDS